MLSKATWLWIAAGALGSAAFGQTVPAAAPIPSDPLELATGQIRAHPNRAHALSLLGRARDNFALAAAGRAYDLKVTFTVDSGGQTEYDGAWGMEQMFDPQQGLRWTANAAGGYEITRITVHGMHYQEDTASYIPLRLQEARAALFDPIATADYVAHATIRASNSVFHGAPVTCLLLSNSRPASGAAPGRRWDETEDCIDPQSGLLQVHSPVPGRYYAYDYSNAPSLEGHTLPSKVSVTEGGQTVSEIQVDSLTGLSSADPSLFTPSDEMKARGRAIAMTGAQKISRDFARAPFPPGATQHVVCVFGLVTPSGELVEAHSLQPSDPNSRAAVAAARQMRFSQAAPTGPSPQQHFVFVIERFVSSPAIHGPR